LAYQLTNAPNAQGVCGKITTNNANAVGIIVLIVSISAGAIIFNEEVIYLILFLQSIGLVYLVEVYWLPILDYVLSGLTYLMFFTKVAYSYKDSPPTGVDPQICKGRLFFKQF
jgi:K+-sensing histidine kinase KdpD